jgi:hypothetical protein
MARKNAALQRIIKAILAKLREDGGECAALAAAVAGGGGGGGLGPPSARLGVEAAEDGPPEQQAGDEPSQDAKCDGDGGQQAASQRRPSTGSGGAAAADQLAGALAERVVALTDELEAARQALAAAAGLSVAAPASADGGCAGERQRNRGGAPARPQPRSSRARQGKVTTTVAERGGGGTAAALEDGVAAFVLFAVQQLRRALPESRSEWSCGAIADGAGAPVSEQLARMLLELLHSYSREQTEPFRGLRMPPAAEGLEHGAMDAPQGGDSVPGSVPGSPAAAGNASTAAAGYPFGGPAATTAYAGPSRATLDPGPAPLAPLPGIEELLTAAESEARAGSGRGSPQPRLAHAPAALRLGGGARRV